MAFTASLALLAVLSAAPVPAVSTPLAEEPGLELLDGVEPLEEHVTLVGVRPAFQADESGGREAKAAGRSALACVLTFGVLGAFTAFIGTAALACGFSILLAVVGIYTLVQGAWLAAGLAFGSACGSCGVSGIFAFLAAGMAGAGGYLRSVGLWSWEAQMVFQTMMSIMSWII